MYDSVTKLPNVELFKNNIEEYIYNIKNSASDAKSSLVLIKMKNFKSFQSFYGKVIGDEIILKVKERLESGTR